MKNYQVLLWDVDDTLLDFPKSEEYAFFHSLKKFDIECTYEDYKVYSEINDKKWKLLELGQITREEVLVGRFRDFFEYMGIHHIDVTEFQPVYQDELGSVFYFIEKADSLLLRLKEAGYKQYLVTNGVVKTQAKKLKLSGLDKIVDGIFISEAVGYNKPSREYFEKVLTEIDANCKENILLIGDSLSSDIKGGKNAGIPTCLFIKNKEKLNQEQFISDIEAMKPDYVIESLWNVFEILEGKESYSWQNLRTKN